MSNRAVLEPAPAAQKPEWGRLRGGRAEPPWLAEARRQATEWIARQGYPTRKHEDWRYVDLKPLLALDPLLAQPDGPAGAEAQVGVGRPVPPPVGGTPGALDLGLIRLVLMNGRCVPELSHLGGLPTGVRVTSLAAAIVAGHPGLSQHWAQPADGYRHAFEALNVAEATDGVLVEIPDGVSVESPIEIAYLSGGRIAGARSTPRTVIVVGSGSSATVVETFTGAGGVYLTNAHTRVVTGAGARLEHYRLQAEDRDAFHLSCLDVHPGPGSHFASRLLAVGGRLGRHEVAVGLAHEDAVVDLAGLYLPAGDSCHDNPVLVEHLAAGCSSRQTYKGIVDGAGHGVFNGRVVVAQGAAGTDAHQTNRNLLLSDRAEVDTRPRLEIYADDVSCTHGAAVGQLDDDALFYLRSRGLSEGAARELLIRGFAQEILEQFACEPIRRRAEQMVVRHLAAGTDGLDRDQGGRL